MSKAGHFNQKGNMGYLKTRFLENTLAGEKSIAAEFRMTVDGHPELTTLVRTTQYPAIGRHAVEDFGGMGLQFEQQGTFENKGEITVSVVETITGLALDAIRDIVKNKQSVNITIQATPESMMGLPSSAHKFRLEHCNIRCDAVDLSTEDVAALVRPNMTIVYNWFEL